MNEINFGMFKNEEDEDSEGNNKYIMSNDEEKNIKIETTTNEMRMKRKKIRIYLVEK